MCDFTFVTHKIQTHKRFESIAVPLAALWSYKKDENKKQKQQQQHLNQQLNVQKRFKKNKTRLAQQSKTMKNE